MGKSYCGQLGVLETVRCLDCGDVYAKPAGVGTVQANPGCPRCGYVGWIPLSVRPVTRKRPRHDVDLLQLPRARSD
jgi:phage FluMu protein Com